MKQQKKKKEFNDLLIPIIIVLAVLPFVVRLISYDSGFADYSWYSNFDIVHDFFSYYKSYAFLLISIVALIILVPYLLLHRGELKDMRIFLPLGVYAVFVLLSTVTSVNIHSTISGGYAHFESVFVLLGYIIMLIYTYQIEKKEEDYKSILKAFIISLIFLIIIGFLQMIGRDLLYERWVQKLIIPSSDWKDYIGNIKTHLSTNAVALTLFNPNYASVYLAMAIPFLITMILPTVEKSGQNNANFLTKRERIGIFVISLLLTVLLFKTYSRSGLLSLLITLVVIALFHRKLLFSKWKQSCIIAICGILLFVGIDFINEFRYINKLGGTVQSFLDKQDTTNLDKIITKDTGVSITINNEMITVSFAKVTNNKQSLEFQNASGENITSFYNSKTMKLDWNHYKEVTFKIKAIEDKNYIFCEINNIIWRFYQDNDEEYVYFNDFDKKVQLTEIKHIGLKSMEDIGSGRGYIWSRSIPLLKDSLFIGSGPDTFPYVFPQTDYVGKANNCKTPYTLIEKPHSFYLMMGIQTGIISLIAFVIFYLIYMVKSIRIYKNNSLSDFKTRMGLACFIATLSFMISGFFNDSSLHTTPFFIILLGIGMDINAKLVTLGIRGNK